MPNQTTPTCEQLARTVCVIKMGPYTSETTIQTLARLLESEKPDGIAYRNAMVFHATLQNSISREAVRIDNDPLCQYIRPNGQQCKNHKEENSDYCGLPGHHV